ncbi:helix-turn-helix transcriptional regulator [Streptomyces sp. NPDC059740]|uniref:helix-turn-helix transcriptional regulator n=1 Tax=Streptomyces sp. NPDC059740 TaxID=3346926 RepID=UPI003654D587
MRAARLVKMVLLLQARPGMTGAELATELGVSERTVGRDALALSEAGVPVYADRGRVGGYRLVAGYRTSLTGLADDEARALLLSGVPSALRELGLTEAASTAALKVAAALAPTGREAAAGAALRFHLDAPAWYREPEPPALLPAVAGAVRDDQVVRVRYLRGDREVEREVEPHGLVLKAGVWYLAARVREAGGPAPDGGPGPGDGGSAAVERPSAFRVYRVDRVAAVTPTGDRFARRDDFDLPSFWAGHAAAFARSLLREEVRVRLTPAGARLLPLVTDAAAAREGLAGATGPDEAGRVTLTLAVESAEVAFSQLLALGAEAEVLAPAPLRERFTATARRLAELYGPQQA